MSTIRSISSVTQAPEQSLKILRTQSLSSVVFESLEHAILNGEMEPGERINETAIAEKYGVSRGPVREACRRLEEAGLVDFIVNRGVFVKKLAFEDALEIYQIRAALFAFAGRILAQRITNDQIAQLSRLIEDMEAASARQAPDVYYARNLEFHAALMRFTGYRRLVRLYEGLNKELHVFRRRGLNEDANRRASCDEHRLIVDELKGGNSSRIARVMRTHSMAGINRTLRAMDLPAEERARASVDWSEEEDVV
ncbi:FCD domain-containing protein [Shumkonia mesophila]|uniref:FCD domain-containing protein n=1 Tax=Shumkonia mesophila TaxID=2838854 RepID=UPI0029341559|nr:FCD domain-containing protein [Shumkonia mesophila]